MKTSTNFIRRDRLAGGLCGLLIGDALRHHPGFE